MRILVVEDEKKVAKALRDGLEQTFGSEYEAFRVRFWPKPDPNVRRRWIALAQR